MRIVCLYAGRACLLWLAAMAAAPLSAAEPDPAPAPAASARKPAAPEGACIDTEVNGYRALSYDCLNQKMAPAAAPRPPGGLESEAVTQRPPNQMGLPTPATIGNRMGNTFGTSAFPQRPQP
ncbi:hypothetical protein [Achromobacter deleyi]|uniref:hypothetical protein n=1 Tax=Achromobacter deleyi TaxID=1353891 RepID=UPI0014926A1F|nr:hypothetical protein [Achromobacter deleyi]QVQ26995.1 hypothetical protein HLG70_00580 [Achromobacter deleyi]UIP22574.1 hypothetical protein LYZ39_08680 [Achromobacter deleyi]